MAKCSYVWVTATGSVHVASGAAEKTGAEIAAVLLRENHIP